MTQVYYSVAVAGIEFTISWESTTVVITGNNTNGEAA